MPAPEPSFRVGTSRWSYPNWCGPFYPPDLRSSDWLACYARRFATVELNASFYRLPTPEMIERWSSATPLGFLFALKAWRVITHERRLVDCAQPLEQFLARLAPLAGKVGPILFQLPPRFPIDPVRLGQFLAGLPGGYRYAFEFRDPSWWCDEIYARLTDAGVAFVCFDLAGLRSPRIATGSLAYVRLHGYERRYRAAYPAAVLTDWARWLVAERRAGRDVAAYLDNTMIADHAVRDAERLVKLLEQTTHDH